MVEEKYSIAMRILHWVMALLIVWMVALGWSMSEIEGQDPSRMFYFNLHKSFGVLVLGLIVIRVIVRAKSSIPSLPDAIAVREAKLAKFGHFGLYALMFATPLVGFAMSNAFGYPVALFGWKLPFIFPINKDMGELLEETHGFLAYTLLGLVGLHVAGVIKHRVKERINLLKRMM